MLLNAPCFLLSHLVEFNIQETSFFFVVITTMFPALCLVQSRQSINIGGMNRWRQASTRYQESHKEGHRLVHGGGEGVLGCTLQARKPCTCLSLITKEEPGVSNRDIRDLVDGGSYVSESRSWTDNPPCVAGGR